MCLRRAKGSCNREKKSGADSSNTAAVAPERALEDSSDEGGGAVRAGLAADIRRHSHSWQDAEHMHFQRVGVIWLPRSGFWLWLAFYRLSLAFDWGAHFQTSKTKASKTSSQ
jgi:hypothetical protein